MESRHPNKNLSHAHSGKNAYADILSGGANLGAQILEQDYNLIFNNSNASSIPVLDLPDDTKTTRFVDFSSWQLNYSDVFRGLNDDEAVGVYYQDLTKSSSNDRTQSATRNPLNSSERSTFPEEIQLFTSEALSQSINDKKRFKMSYYKTRAGSKDGSSGRIHVAQFRPEPGFTYFVADSAMQESKVDKPDPSVTSDICRKLDFSDGILESKFTKKGMPHFHTQKSNRRGDFRTRLYEGGSYSGDRLLNEHWINLTPHPTNERLAPCVTANLEENSGYTKRSMASNSVAPKGIASQHAADDISLPSFGEEFDVNSPAAVSAAALKDAIQKAQESIRIAKELMERKMGGLRNRSDWVFEDGLRVKDREVNSSTLEGNITEDINAKDTCETVDSVHNVLSGRQKSIFIHEQDAPDFKDDEISFTSWKVISDVHAQNRSKTAKREPALATILNIEKNRTSSLSRDQQVVGNRETAQCMDKHECNANERNITKETLIKQEIIVEKAHELGSIRKKLHADVKEKKPAENVDNLSKHVKMEKPLIFQESGDCDDDVEEERFEDACECIQNEDESIDDLGSVNSEKEENATHMAEVTERGRRLARIHVPTNKKKRSVDVHDYEESGEKFGELKLIASKNGFKTNGYGKHENKHNETDEIEVLQHAQYVSSVIIEIDSWSHDTSDKITKTRGARQPFMIDESSKTEQVNDTSRIIDKATNNVYDFKVGEAGETKVASKLNNIEPLETATLVQGGAEDSETRKNKNTIFEVLPSEGSIPKVGLIDMDLKSSKADHRDKDFKSNINPDNDTRTSVSRYIESDYAFGEGGNHGDEEAVKSHLDMSDEEVQHVGIMKNFKAYSGPRVSSKNEKVIQVHEEMRARQDTQINGKSLCKTVAGEEEETKSNEVMKTDNVMEVNEDTPKVLFATEGTETKKEKSKALEEKEYLRKVYEESKRERQREIDRRAVGRLIQEARDRVFAGAREKAERAMVERATAEVQQRVMAEKGKLEKATTAVKLSAEKSLIEAKLRSERAAVERATAEARERAAEKALSQKTALRTQVLQRPDDTYTESAQRRKARLERQERIMERVAKALAEKNMRDLLAREEEAEKNRLAESLDAQIKRWFTGKEGNLRALLSTLQYILGPGSGWKPISLTDILTSNAVKKAYRKATLYVHPDKLQQRGASIREKYICEKVFDLLKVGWARFSSEER